MIVVFPFAVQPEEEEVLGYLAEVIAEHIPVLVQVMRDNVEMLNPNIGASTPLVETLACFTLDESDYLSGMEWFSAHFPHNIPVSKYSSVRDFLAERAPPPA